MHALLPALRASSAEGQVRLLGAMLQSWRAPLDTSEYKRLLHALLQAEERCPAAVAHSLLRHALQAPSSRADPTVLSAFFAVLARASAWDELAQSLAFVLHASVHEDGRTLPFDALATTVFPSVAPFYRAFPAALRGFVPGRPLLLSCLRALARAPSLRPLRDVLTLIAHLAAAHADIPLSPLSSLDAASLFPVLMHALAERGHWAQLRALRRDMEHRRLDAGAEGLSSTLHGALLHVKRRVGQWQTSLPDAELCATFEELHCAVLALGAGAGPSLAVRCAQLSHLLQRPQQLRSAVALLVRRRLPLPDHVWSWLIESYAQRQPGPQDRTALLALIRLLTEWQSAAEKSLEASPRPLDPGASTATELPTGARVRLSRAASAALEAAALSADGGSRFAAVLHASGLTMAAGLGECGPLEQCALVGFVEQGSLRRALALWTRMQQCMDEAGDGALRRRRLSPRALSSAVLALHGLRRWNSVFRLVTGWMTARERRKLSLRARNAALDALVRDGRAHYALQELDDWEGRPARAASVALDDSAAEHERRRELKHFWAQQDSAAPPLFTPAFAERWAAFSSAPRLPVAAAPSSAEAVAASAAFASSAVPSVQSFLALLGGLNARGLYGQSLAVFLERVQPRLAAPSLHRFFHAGLHRPLLTALLDRALEAAVALRLLPLCAALLRRMSQPHSDPLSPSPATLLHALRLVQSDPEARACVQRCWRIRRRSSEPSSAPLHSEAKEQPFALGRPALRRGRLPQRRS